MLAPEEVAAMVQLHRLGWGTKRIAGELGCSRNTVKRYLAAGGWAAIRRPRRKRRLDGLEEWLAECFRQHRGNCDVVRQDLLREHGIKVSLRTVERAVAPLRQALRAEARACLRFETAPGKQLQIDFGATTMMVDQRPRIVQQHFLRHPTKAPERAFHAVEPGRLPLVPKGSYKRPPRIAQCRHEQMHPYRVAADCYMMRPRARCASTNGCTRLRATGASGRTPARHIGHVPRARTSAALATSSAMP
jgi:transposase